MLNAGDLRTAQENSPAKPCRPYVPAKNVFSQRPYAQASKLLRSVRQRKQPIIVLVLSLHCVYPSFPIYPVDSEPAPAYKSSWRSFESILLLRDLQGALGAAKEDDERTVWDQAGGHDSWCS
jgi:hypothetical protein